MGLGPAPKLILETGKTAGYLKHYSSAERDCPLGYRKYKETSRIHLILLPFFLEVPENREGGAEESKKKEASSA